MDAHGPEWIASLRTASSVLGVGKRVLASLTSVWCCIRCSSLSTGLRTSCSSGAHRLFIWIAKAQPRLQPPNCHPNSVCVSRRGRKSSLPLPSIGSSQHGFTREISTPTNSACLVPDTANGEDVSMDVLIPATKALISSSQSQQQSHLRR